MKNYLIIDIAQPVTCPEFLRTMLRAGTLPEARKLSWCPWLLAIFLVTQSKNHVSTQQIKRQFGVAWRTAWFLKYTLLEAMAASHHRYKNGVAAPKWYIGDIKIQPLRP